jgi:hypothetical protein
MHFKKPEQQHPLLPFRLLIIPKLPVNFYQEISGLSVKKDHSLFQ